MHINTKIVFHWTNRNGTKEKLETTGRYFRNYAIELLEDEVFDKVFNVYYTVDNKITKKLDYYNEDFL